MTSLLLGQHPTVTWAAGQVWCLKFSLRQEARSERGGFPESDGIRLEGERGGKER